MSVGMVSDRKILSSSRVPSFYLLKDPNWHLPEASLNELNTHAVSAMTVPGSPKTQIGTG